MTADQGPKPAIPRVAAEGDVESIVDRLVREAALRSPFASSRPMGPLAITWAGIRARAHRGHELDLPSLRSWPIRGFGHLVFYSEEPACLDIWRVLDGAQDLPRWLTDEAPD